MRLRAWVLRSSLALAVAVGGLALPALSERASAMSAGGQPAYVIGDSVLLGASAQIHQQLTEAGWNPTVKAWVGLSMPTAIAAVRADRASIGPVAVLGVGNNYFGNAGAFREEIDEMMSLLSGVGRVVWLNLREFRPDRQDANRELAAAAQRWPNLEIADWNTLSISQPRTFWNDGLHLRPEGAALMAQLVRDRLDAFLSGEPRAATPTTGTGVQPRRAHVYWFGQSTLVGSPDAIVRAPYVGMAANRTGNGYWLAGADGGVFAAGDARFRGSMGGTPLNRPISGIASTPTGRGYWLVASDGGVFSFGDARFFGSLGSLPLNQPIVDMAATPTGRGYWLVAADGGVFTFGDAEFRGSLGATPPNRPIVAVTPTRRGDGYWLVAYDGGVFSFGAAKYHGGLAGRPLFWPVSDLLTARDGHGYLLLDQGGDVHPFGTAHAIGDRKEIEIDDRFFAIASRPGGGYWLAAQRPVQ